MKITENTKKGITVTLVVCAVLFVLLFTIINIGAVGGVMSSVMSVFSPIIIGFALAYILNPILRLFEFRVFKRLKKKNVVRVLSIILTYVVALIILIAVIWLLVPSLVSAITDLVSRYDEYIATTSNLINSVIGKLTSSETINEYVDDAAIKNIIANFFSFSGSALDSILKYVAEYGMGLFVGLKNTILGIFISIYVLISKEKLQAQVRKFGAAVFTDTRQKKIGRYINLTHRSFSGYFVGKLMGSVIVFFLMLILMLVFGMPYPLLISTIVAVTDIIPIFGPIIGSIPSFFIIFIVSPKKALIFIILILLVQQLEGNVISPKILGEATGISSLSVIIAIIIMGEYFGIIGMIIGVPVFAVIITIVKEFVDTRLRKKNKSTDTADYYLKDSAVDPHDPHEPIMQRLFRNIAKQFKKIARIFKKSAKKKNSGTTETSGEQERTQETSGEQFVYDNFDADDGFEPPEQEKKQEQNKEEE